MPPNRSPVSPTDPAVQLAPRFTPLTSAAKRPFLSFHRSASREQFTNIQTGPEFANERRQGAPAPTLPSSCRTIRPYSANSAYPAVKESCSQRKNGTASKPLSTRSSQRTERGTNLVQNDPKAVAATSRSFRSRVSSDPTTWRDVGCRANPKIARR